MAGELAAKQSRAEQLRTELSGLRIEQSANLLDGHNKVMEEKLDDEIAMLERQVAIEREKKESGGSTIDAMAVMAEATRIEEEQAAALAAAQASVLSVPDESKKVDAATAAVFNAPMTLATPVAPKKTGESD